MQLFILGPAFGLASIDAECLAAVALLKLHLEDGQWSIVPTHEQSQRLPYVKTLDSTIHGFRNIANLLESYKDTSNESSQSHADSTAILSFLSSHAQPLLDISLYVAFENYTTTRSAFTHILPWHANYMIPPARRAAARSRTAHLGIASLDVDDVHEDMSNRPPGFDAGREQGFEAATQKRASLLLGRGRASVRSLLQQPEHAAAFKLQAIGEACFDPLADWLGEGTYFLGSEEPGKVDCAVYGFLAFMLFPCLPQDWLAKTLRRKYGPLVRFTERMHDLLGMRTDVEKVMALANCKNEEEVVQRRKIYLLTLPWHKPAISSPVEIARAVTQDLISRIPFLGSSFTLIPASPTKTPAWQRQLPLFLGAAASCFGLFGYYAFATDMLIRPHGEEIQIFGKRRVTDYGHLGAALAGVSLLRQQATGDAAYHHQQQQDSPVQVQVEVEQDG